MSEELRRCSARSILCRGAGYRLVVADDTTGFLFTVEPLSQSEPARARFDLHTAQWTLAQGQPANVEEPQLEMRCGVEDWIELRAPDYSLFIRQFSNKGPLVLVKNTNGDELGRTWFDLDCGWRFQRD